MFCENCLIARLDEHIWEMTGAQWRPHFFRQKILGTTLNCPHSFLVSSSGWVVWSNVWSSHHSTITLELYLLGVWGGFQGAAVVLGVHHGHVRAAVIQHLLHAVHTAALAARADWGAGDGVVAAKAVHLTAGCLAVLHEVNTQSHKTIHRCKHTYRSLCSSP